MALDHDETASVFQIGCRNLTLYIALDHGSSTDSLVVAVDKFFKPVSQIVDMIILNVVVHTKDLSAGFYFKRRLREYYFADKNSGISILNSWKTWVLVPYYVE